MCIRDSAWPVLPEPTTDAPGPADRRRATLFCPAGLAAGRHRPTARADALGGQRLSLIHIFHRPAFLAFTPQGQGVHGLVYGAAQGDAGKRLTCYRLTLVPHLAYLAQRNNQRIFQHLTVPQIVALVLEEHGILADAYRFQLGTR